MMAEEWWYQFPSTTVKWDFLGPEDYARRFIGAAENLLYQLKNNMKFNQLGQLRATRHFSDGTIIIAWSHYGQDHLTIIAPEEPKQRFPLCAVTLINVPQKVPPSRWYEDGIHTFPADPPEHPVPYKEEEGYHYFKTYYAINVIDCPECWGSQQWSVCETDKLMSDIGLVVGCRMCHPFIYDAEKNKYEYEGSPVPHKEEWTQTCGDPPHITYPADPDNHCLVGGCQGEILEFDSDQGGTFFLWKAFTEWSCAGGPQSVDYWSKTGLGYMLLEVKILEKGNLLCSAYEIVKVDCCEKRGEDRELEIWWESLGPDVWTCWTCCYQPWIQVGSMKLCETPHRMGLWYLINLYYSAYVGFQTLYFINGACPPFEWTLQGPGELKSCPPDHASAEWKPPPYYEGCDDVVIKTRDRCGSEHEIIASCCNSDGAGTPEGGPLGIGYETLAMGFDQCQQLMALGGCPPYSWSNGGGGSLSVDPNRSWLAEYCSPESNAQCENNGNVTITDCCGNSASIEIAVTKINLWIALRLCDFVVCSIGGPPNYYEYGQIQCEWWYCDGTSLGPSCYTAAGQWGPCPWCYSGPCDCVLSKGPPYGDWYVCTYGEKSFQCGMCTDPPCDCGVLCDVRTPEMIAEGCCPPQVI
jgi:hypothetical protein